MASVLLLIEVFNLFEYGIFKLKPVLLLPCIIEIHDVGVTFEGGRSECELVKIVDALVRESSMTFIPGEECKQG